MELADFKACLYNHKSWALKRMFEVSQAWTQGETLSSRHSKTHVYQSTQVYNNERPHLNITLGMVDFVWV